MLRKTKITSSILKQSLHAKQDDFRFGKIVGWCVFSNLKYGVIDRDGILKKFILYNSIELIPTTNTDGEPWNVVKVRAENKNHGYDFAVKEEKEAKSLRDTMNSVKEQIESLGQFYI